MAQKTVLIRSTPEGPIQKEWIMDAAVKPGMLVEYASSTRIQVLSATIDPMMRIVVEHGDTAIDGTYDSGDLIPFIVPKRGDEVFAYSTAPADGTLSVGDFLVSHGDGYLIGFDPTGTIAAGEALAIALEEKKYTAGVNVQIKVEVL